MPKKCKGVIIKQMITNGKIAISPGMYATIEAVKDAWIKLGAGVKEHDDHLEITMTQELSLALIKGNIPTFEINVEEDTHSLNEGF